MKSSFANLLFAGKCYMNLVRHLFPIPQGAVKWNDKYIETKTTLPALPVTSDRLAFDIAQDTINNLLEAVITSGSLNNNISYAYVSSLFVCMVMHVASIKFSDI